MQLFGVYTLLFTVTVIITFLPSIITNTSLLWKTDGLLQHYENLVFLKHRIEQLWTDGSFPFWSWSIGLGADSVASMVSMGYPCFDVFSYIVVLFPEEKFPLLIPSKFFFSFTQPVSAFCILEK